jgi:integrase
MLTRTPGLLGAIFAWGQDNGYVENNPVRGVKRFADAQKKALLTSEQYLALALALTLEALEDKRDRKDGPVHSAVGLAAIRFIALTVVRRGECENLKWDEVDTKGKCIALGETKTGPSLRPLSRAAFAIIEKQDPIADFTFPAGPEAEGYQGLPGYGGPCKKPRVSRPRRRQSRAVNRPRRLARSTALRSTAYATALLASRNSSARPFQRLRRFLATASAE